MPFAFDSQQRKWPRTCCLSDMDIFVVNYAKFLSFILTFIRVSIVVFLLPFFGGKAAPSLIKAALCLAMTIGLWPHLSFDPKYFPNSVWGLFIIVFGELILGMVLSLAIRCIFSAAQTAGQIIGFQMGFSMMNVVDPLTGISIELTSQLTYMVALLLFLSFNGHLFLLAGLAKSFELIPPGALLINPKVFHSLVYFSSEIFVIAIKIAAPVMVAELLVSTGLGIIARLAPQINVLFVGFPIKIAIGFFFMGVMFDLTAFYISHVVNNMDVLFKSLLIVK